MKKQYRLIHFHIHVLVDTPTEHEFQTGWTINGHIFILFTGMGSYLIEGSFFGTLYLKIEGIRLLLKYLPSRVAYSVHK